jgi:ABC-type dipeptide/oligopeptide/nickel transport system permease subunit
VQGRWHIVRQCVLRNLYTTMRAVMPMALAYSLLTASTLSFLGLGERADFAEWGALLAESRFNFPRITFERCQHLGWGCWW